MLILSDDVQNRNLPFINILLLAINGVVFVLMLVHNCFTEQFVHQWALVPAQVVGHRDFESLIPLITSMFMHAGPAHIIGNLWVLYLFGDNVEERLGHFTYLLFYITCGFFAEALHILAYPGSTIPALGASGAIAGVMGAYLVLHPHAKCNTWWGDDVFFVSFRTFKIPAMLVIGVWFAFQVLSTQISGTHGGVAVYAHIGGFLGGIALLTVLRYNDYETNQSTRYPGLMPIVCTVAFIGVSWHLMQPRVQAASLRSAQLAAPATPAVSAPKVSAPEQARRHSAAKHLSPSHSHNKVQTHAKAHRRAS